MRRLVALLCVGCASCGIDIDAFGPTHLSATDPALLDSAGAIVFTFSSTSSCRDLVNAPMGEFVDVINQEAAPAVQRIPMLRGQVDPDRAGPQGFDDVDATHTFATVPSNVPVALVALAVDQDPGAGFALKDVVGTVFATACRDAVFEAGKHVEIPLVLAPAGLH